MSDRKIEKAMLSLLRLGLWGEKGMGNVLPLSPEQWLELYQCAQRHTIEGIVFDSFQHLPADLLPPRNLMLKWVVRIEQIERHNTKINQCIKEQLDIFHHRDIFPVLLKGQGIAACYDIPGHRISGDVDWYFDRHSDYLQANEMFRHSGIDFSYNAGFSVGYLWRGIVTEHHKRMFDIHNPLCFRFLDRLQKRFSGERLQREVGGNTLHLPAPILMMLQVNVHILKHLLSFGVGIRQLCDAARVYHVFRLDVNGEELRRIYQTLGILRWIDLLHTVLVKFIGLSPQSLPFELPEATDADWMMDEIWMSGNFGFFDSRFEEDARQPGFVRNQATRRVWSNVCKYLKYAPMEAISFPLVQIYSKYAGK